MTENLKAENLMKVIAYAAQNLRTETVTVLSKIKIYFEK
jgi:hypothetical protein